MFIEGNKLSLPARCHTALTSTVASCVEELLKQKKGRNVNVLNVPQVVDILGNRIFAAISPEWRLPQPLAFHLQFLHVRLTDAAMSA